MWTGMTARVRGPIFSSSLAGSMHQVLGSASTSTGRAPAWMTVFAETISVKSGISTSSPGATPSAVKARWRAVVQLEVATP